MRLGFLAKILPPPENRFYDHFEEGAAVCLLSAQLYDRIVHSPVAEREAALADTRANKRRGSQALKSSVTLLNNSFITPIDREDIQLIASNLYKATKIILKACVNLRVCRIGEYNEIIHEQADLLVTAAEELQRMVGTLRHGAPVKEVSRHSFRIQDIESSGDEVLQAGMEELFSGDFDALRVLQLRTIYRGIENALDICSTISDLIVNISLKHS